MVPPGKGPTSSTSPLKGKKENSYETKEPESTGKKWVKSIPLNIHRSSRDFCSVWAFTHWVKMRNRVRARGYWSKPHFSLPYPWIWERAFHLLALPQRNAGITFAANSSRCACAHRGGSPGGSVQE